MTFSSDERFVAGGSTYKKILYAFRGCLGFFIVLPCFCAISWSMFSSGTFDERASNGGWFCQRKFNGEEKSAWGSVQIENLAPLCWAPLWLTWTRSMVIGITAVKQGILPLWYEPLQVDERKNESLPNYDSVRAWFSLLFAFSASLEAARSKVADWLWEGENGPGFTESKRELSYIKLVRIAMNNKEILQKLHWVRSHKNINGSWRFLLLLGKCTKGQKFLPYIILGR